MVKTEIVWQSLRNAFSRYRYVAREWLAEVGETLLVEFNQFRTIRGLYPRPFLETIPIPERWDGRPLPNLVHRSQHPQQELARLERWFRELKSSEKLELRQRLRSFTNREFWSAYFELVTSRIAKSGDAVSVRHAPLMRTKRPDFLVEFPCGAKQIWEVATAYQTSDRQRDEAKVYEVANWIHRNFQSRWAILVDADQFTTGGVSVKNARQPIQDWLTQLDSGGEQKLILKPPRINFCLSLTAIRQRDLPGPVVTSLMGQGGNLTATDRIRNILRKKVKKYDSAKKMLCPLIVFLFEGDWMHVPRESLEWAIWGEWVVRFRPGTDETEMELAPGGLFMPNVHGSYQNTRLSAVVYGSRVWNDGAVHASLYVYHHPGAKHPLSDDLFGEIPQCRVTFSETHLIQSWNSDREAVKIMRLD